jgi:hypothetical protein
VQVGDAQEHCAEQDDRREKNEDSSSHHRMSYFTHRLVSATLVR